MAKQLNWQFGTLVEIRRETPRVKSLLLDVPDWTRHLAGQRVDVRLTAEDGYQAQRSYSIASPPEDARLMLTVDRIEDGEVSPYLTDELGLGERLELRGPIGGYFVWDANDGMTEGVPLLLIAGGSGIAPLMAMIRHRANSGTRVPTKLVYSSRSVEDIIYREELERYAREDPSLHITHTLTRQRPPGWSGYGRRIDTAMLAEAGFQPADRPLVYVCGSTSIVEAVATILLKLGHDPERIKTERFGPTGN